MSRFGGGVWGARGLWRALLAVAAASLLLACGGGEDRSKARVRFVNASGYPSLGMGVDETLRFAAVPFGSGATYVDVDPAATDTTLAVPGSATPLVSLAPVLVKRNHYTVLAHGAEGSLQASVLDDEVDLPGSGKALLRVFNGARDAGTLDVYLTGDADDLAAAVPLHAAAAVGSASAFASVNRGSWRLRVTAANRKDDLRLDLRSVDLGDRQVLTVVLAPAVGGVLVDAVLLIQQGDVIVRRVVHARVRAVAGMPASGSVAVGVGGVDLLAGIGSPAVSEYSLVPAGLQTVTASVNGTDLGAAGHDLVAGADYTLMVHAPSAAPALAWIEDDNRLPVAAGRAKLRLVHGVSAETPALSLTVDGLPVAGSVAGGSASEPKEVLAGSGLELRVTAVGVPAPVFVGSDRSLASGGVYTLFVLGDPAAADGILRQDR